MAIAKMSAAELEKFLDAEYPQIFRGGDISIESADGTSCLLRQRYNDRMLRPGGTVSGPTLMALADFAMFVVLLSAIGPVGLGGDDQSQHQFSAQGPARAGCPCGSEASEAGPAACGRRGQLAVGDADRSDRSYDRHLFHSKRLVFYTVL